MSGGVLKSGITLAAIAAICTLLVAATFHMTAARIAANEQEWLERSLEPALSGVFFEGSLTICQATTQRSSTAYSPTTARRPHCLP